VATLVLASCGQPRPGATVHDALQPCRIASVHRPVQCGRITVPLRREDPETTIELEVTVVPAREARQSDGVMLIAGGPGQAATEVFPPLLQQFAEINRTRDLIMVDQRGTGGSHPLRCPRDEHSLSAEVSVDVDAERLIACAAELEVDPALFGTHDAVADLEVVRKKLGYDALDLVGGSYGTRVALQYAKTYPEHTRALVLDGVAPMGMKLPLSFARDGQDALDAMIDNCTENDACAAAFPDLPEIVATLTAPDVPAVKTTIAHPRTGEPTELEIDREQMAAAIRAMLYAPELTAVLPVSLAQAREGNYAPLMGQLLAMGDSQGDAFYEGMYLSVICREDVRQIEDAEIDPAVEGTFFGRTMVDSMRRACKAWPDGSHPVVPPPDGDTHDTPALILSGELDPATPRRWGQTVEGDLASRHIVVPGAGHGTLTNHCVSGIVAEFLEHPEPSALDASCVDEQTVTPFFIDLCGPEV
jgi:pimeloyl-ACP methyl ester carboxylesterase